MKNILELKDVSLTYQTPDDEINAIDKLNFGCDEGDFLSIIGPVSYTHLTLPTN